MSESIKQLSAEQLKEVKRQMAIYTQGVKEIIPIGDLEEKVAKSVLKKLKQFQDNGHIVQLLIGDFTGKIGDPTGKSTARKPLTTEEVKENAKTYFEQFGKVMDMKKVELHYNSSWLAKLNFEDVIGLAGKITVARLMERDDFEARIEQGKAISLHEFFYPLMQGYDSVALECDVELGGTDQHFNVLMGRHFQEKFNKEKQVAMLMPILEGLDGVEKMSKSKNNYIGINEDPKDMYGKAMSIPDELMTKYFELVTDFSLEEVEDIKEKLASGVLHPRDAKMLLGKTLVRMYHSVEAAQQAEKDFISVFQQKEMPADIPLWKWTGESKLPIIEFLMTLKLFSSKSEARRMIQNNGVKLDGVKAEDINATVTIKDGMVVQVGKRKFIKVVL